ncbi:MAG: acyl-phosphate glycerol 3-phosphate acyltransferase [Cryomorphaceae bacterium BACL21 MAG-121220-bin10]|jgi:1-acyl-sn-glycerol-3-phosphate acyltransferase|nr:MAG: acyl-phosphate glycerol 3-phosphate acyltransferase [Cryomorphaceae bacterium BACL21 MAG-121220-bin10]|tara:strand:+ start:15746 stop:16492 length:747 start_codon:yes stop_codon:yes gene_type:complete
MKIIGAILMVVYRLWFYLLVMVGISLFSPLLMIGSLKESWYGIYFAGARWWGMFVLFGMGFLPKIDRQVRYKKGENYMFVSNHTSMMDIMLMLYVANRPFVFVGKKELSKIPLFGYFYKRGCILVDRNDPSSRRDVYAQAQKRLKAGLSICIFPEGGVPDPSIELSAFKDGAFRLAIEHKIPIAPMTFLDNKKRFPYAFFDGSMGRMRVIMHEFLPTANLEIDHRRKLKEQTRTIILDALQADVAAKT